MKINFNEVMVFEDVARTSGEIKNLRQAFANFIYKEQTGKFALALARKISRGNNETEFTPEEVELIRTYSNDLPAYYFEAISEILDDDSHPENHENERYLVQVVVMVN